MIDKFQEYLRSGNHQKALDLIVSPKFYRSLLPDQIKHLIKIVQNNQSANQYPSSIQLAMYSIIIMKTHTNLYNQKLAIDNLLKLYKQSNNLNKQIICALLIRINSFSNYRLIVNDITPKFIPGPIMNRQSCGGLFKKQVSHIFQQKWKLYKDQWIDCSIGILQRDYASQFQEVKNMIQQIYTNENIDGYNLMEIKQSINRQYSYLTSKIKKLSNENINIDAICSSVDFIFKLTILNKNFTNQKQEVIIQSQNLTLDYLKELMKCLQKRLFRKIKWIYYIIKDGLSNIQVTKIDLSRYIQLLGQYLKIFGQGSIDNKQIIFQSEYCIKKILQPLLNTKFSQKQPQEQINYQKTQDKKQKNKQYILNIFNMSNNHYQKYLSNKTINYRSKLIKQCLRILIGYYKSTRNYYKASQILYLIDNAKNKLKYAQNLIYQQLKNLFFKSNIQTQPNFEYFCEDVFQNYIKTNLEKVKNKSLNVVKLEALSILPQKKRKKLSGQEQQPQNIRRTQSVQMEGWGADQYNNINKSKNSNEVVSEMFYSIRECSVNEQQQIHEKINNKNNCEQIDEQQGNILTPQF